MIKISNLSFGYTGIKILDELNFSAKSGSFVGILGPNGCGKSTILKNIMRILKPNSGEIEILGRNLKEFSQKELAKTIGFVPQKSNLNAPLNVREILLMGRYAHIKNAFWGYDKSDFAKVDEVMEMLDITKFQNRTAYELSGGEFGRVLLARAIVGEPRILLLDEPTSALDLNHAVEILSLCKRLSKELNLLSIAVLHELNLASLFCDEINLIKDGKVHYKGTPNELFTKEILKEIYEGMNCDIITHDGNAMIIPKKEEK